MGLQLAQNRGWWPRRSAARTAQAVQAAERDAEAAALRYQQLRAAAAAGTPLQSSLRSWQKMLLLVVGGGLVIGALLLWLLATMYLGYVAMLALPVIAGVVALIVVRVRRSRTRRRRPTVHDLVSAVQEMREAEATIQRARGRGGAAAGPAPLTPPGPPTAPRSTSPPGPASR